MAAPRNTPDTPAAPGEDRTVLGMLKRRAIELEDRLEAEEARFDNTRREHDATTKRMRAELDDVRDAVAKLEAA